MLRKVFDTMYWLPPYFGGIFSKAKVVEKPQHIYLCICDHFEPYWHGADKAQAKSRLTTWLEKYPKVAASHLDSDGEPLKYSFFYPEEEYQYEDLKALSELCHAGFGEVEIHLHHDNDNSSNLRKTLNEYKARLHGEHGLLSTSKAANEIMYGFIHGNWALDNSRKDGRWCGVNDEISILKDTGCYADFTLPSAPSDTQTRKINSIYYAVDNPTKPKSHDWGKDAVAGKSGEGLLMIQGSLCLNWRSRKYGLIPRIENSGLMANNPPSAARSKLWIKTGICVGGNEGGIFIKLHTHGAQEQNINMFFDDAGFDILFSCFESLAAQGIDYHYVSAREMANIVMAYEDGATRWDNSHRDYQLQRNRQ